MTKYRKILFTSSVEDIDLKAYEYGFHLVKDYERERIYWRCGKACKNFKVAAQRRGDHYLVMTHTDSNSCLHREPTTARCYHPIARRSKKRRSLQLLNQRQRSEKPFIIAEKAGELSKIMNYLQDGRLDFQKLSIL